MAKKYCDFTAEEKAEYARKRKAYTETKREKASSAVDTLKAELNALLEPADALRLIALLDAAVKPSGATVERETYLTAMFGTETPAPGTVVSYKYIGTRGPNGERMQPGEDMPAFISRVGDVQFKHDAASINQMVWYVNRRDHSLINDKVNCTVTFES